MLGWDDMGPPELSQDLKAGQPVLPVARDAEDGAPIWGPAVQVAPLAVKHVHQALHLVPIQAISIKYGVIMYPVEITAFLF